MTTSSTTLSQEPTQAPATLSKGSESTSAAGDIGGNEVTPVTARLNKLPNGVPVEATQSSTEAPAKGAEAGSSGLPQLDISLWPGQMVWLLIIFGFFFVFMSRFATPRLRQVLNKRGSTIAEDLANARAIRDEAEAQAAHAREDVVAAQTTARQLAADARARVSAEAEAEKAREDERLNALLAKAEGEIRTARDTAMGHVHDIAVDTAQTLYKKLTGETATKSALNALLKTN